MNAVIYRLDQNDRLTFVNSSWFIFAENNGLQMREASQLLGTRLWKHIADESVRHFYSVFMAKVRKTGEPVTIPFRCDSPDLKRFMQMTISRHNENELEFRTILLCEVARTSAEHPAPGPTRSDPAIMMCLWCKNVKTNRWLRAEEAVCDLSLFEKPRLPIISHVTCPSCESMGLNSVIES